MRVCIIRVFCNGFNEQVKPLLQGRLHGANRAQYGKGLNFFYPLGRSLPTAGFLFDAGLLCLGPLSCLLLSMSLLSYFFLNKFSNAINSTPRLPQITRKIILRIFCPLPNAILRIGRQAFRLLYYIV